MENKLRIAVCEDDQTQLAYLLEMVDSWAAETGQDCVADGYISAEQLIFSFDRDFPYRIYLLDISMGEMSGMDLARKIRERDRDAGILFLTGLKEYVLEGYEVGAFRYLIKPVHREEVFQVLNELVDRELPKETSYFILEQRGELLKIPYDDIWYVASQGHYVELSYGRKKESWKAAFGEIQSVFEENGFVLCRRGVVVNLKRILRIGRTECVLENGETIPISRSQYKNVNEAFIRYYRKGADATLRNGG